MKVAVAGQRIETPYRSENRRARSSCASFSDSSREAEQAGWLARTAELRGPEMA
jgi:hypothetical protein